MKILYLLSILTLQFIYIQSQDVLPIQINGDVMFIQEKSSVIYQAMSNLTYRYSTLDASGNIIATYMLIGLIPFDIKARYFIINISIIIAYDYQQMAFRYFNVQDLQELKSTGVTLPFIDYQTFLQYQNNLFIGANQYTVTYLSSSNQVNIEQNAVQLPYSYKLPYYHVVYYDFSYSLTYQVYQDNNQYLINFYKGFNICISGCQKCSSISKCIKCQSPLYLDSQFQCVSTCPAQFMPDDTDQQCVCRPNSFLQNQSCPCNIPYVDINGTCQQNCPQYCKTCSTQTICSECQNGYFLTADAQCVSSCPANFIVDQANKKCICDSTFIEVNGICQPLCPKNCKICSSQISCTACKTGYVLTIDGFCESSCPQTFIADSTNTKCICDINRTIQNNQCIACQDGCIKCTSPTDCQQYSNCTAQFKYDYSSQTCVQCLWDVQELKCVTSCTNQQIYNQQKQICQQCYYYNSQCLSSCPIGFYSDNSFQCQQCNQQCQSCNGPNVNQCTSCKFPLFLQDDNSCSICELGQFLDQEQNICKSCNISCLACDGPNSNNCLSCIKDQVLSKDTKECLTQSQMESQIKESQKMEYSNCEQTNIDCSSLFGFSEVIQKIFLGIFITTMVTLFFFLVFSSSNSLIGWYSNYLDHGNIYIVCVFGSIYLLLYIYILITILKGVFDLSQQIYVIQVDISQSKRIQQLFWIFFEIRKANQQTQILNSQPIPQQFKMFNSITEIETVLNCTIDSYQNQGKKSNNLSKILDKSSECINNSYYLAFFATKFSAKIRYQFKFKIMFTSSKYGIFLFFTIFTNAQNNFKETNAIVYKAYSDQTWRYSIIDRNGNIIQTYLINGMHDLGITNYILEDQLLYFFTDDDSQYQLIDLSLLTNNKQNYYSSSTFKHYQNYCQYPIVRKYGPHYYFICLGKKGFCLYGSSLENLKTSNIYIPFNIVYFEQTYLMFDKNYLVYKNNIFTSLKQVTQPANYQLIDETFDIFLSDNKLCKAKMLRTTFYCSKMYDFKADAFNKGYVIISKVFEADGIKLIFGYDFFYEKYVFFDAQSLNEIQTSGDEISSTNDPLDIIQYQNYVFIKANLYQVNYNPSLSQINIKLISTSLSYYQNVNFPINNQNFQQGETILLTIDNKNYILNIQSLFPKNISTCPQNCFYCSSSYTDFCLICNLGYMLNAQGQCDQIKCIQNCNQCNDSKACQICDTGYLLQFDQTCNNQCPISAQKDNNNSKCICDQNGYLFDEKCQCNSQFYMSQNQCLKCTQNCDECSNSTQCITCSIGFYLFADGSCDICNTQGGYFISGNLCLPCQNNCLVCSDKNTCTKFIQCGAQFAYDIIQQKCVQCLWDTQANQCVNECKNNQFNNLIKKTCDLIQIDCSNLSNLSDSIQKLFLGLFVLTQILLFIYFCICSSNLLGWYYLQIIQLLGNLAFDKNMNVFWLNIGFLKNLQSYNLFNLIIYNPFQNSSDKLIDFNKFSLGIIISDFYQNFIQNNFYQLAGLQQINAKGDQLQCIDGKGLMMNYNQFTYKNQIYNDLSNLNLKGEIHLIDLIQDIFLINNKLCKAEFQRNVFKCSNAYDFSVDPTINNIILSKVFSCFQVSIIFGYNYQTSSYVFFDAQTLGVIESFGDPLPFYDKYTSIYQFQNNVFLQNSLFSITYIFQTKQVNIKLISSSLKNKYILVYDPYYDQNFQQGQTIFLQDVDSQKMQLIKLSSNYPQNCLQCQILESAQCFACTQLNFLHIDGICVTKCPQTFIVDDQKKQCACRENSTLDKQQCNCNESFYDDGNLCSPCPQNCTKCNQKNQCLICSNKYLLTIDGSCVNICPNTFIPDSSNTKCVCPQNSTLKDQICQCNTAYTFSENLCLPCPSYCDQCDSITICTKCSQNYFLSLSNKCVSQCPSTFIIDQSYTKCVCPNNSILKDNKCIPCQDGCIQCTSETNCTKYPECDAGFKYDLLLKQCVKCYWDVQQSKCVTQCADNQYLDKQLMICQQRCFYYKDQCQNSCPKGYNFDKNFQCYQCDPQCKLCNGPNSNQCTKCNYPLFLQDDYTCSQCQLGKFLDQKQNICQSCSFSCLTCNGPNSNNCLTCTGDLILEKETNTCDQTNIDCDSLFSLQVNLQKFSLGLLITTAIIVILFLNFSSLNNLLGWYFIQIFQLIGNLSLDKKLNLFWLNIGLIKNFLSFNILNLASNSFQQDKDLEIDLNQYQLGIQVQGEKSAIIYKAQQDKTWRYSQLDQNGFITQTNLIQNMDDLDTSYYFIEDQSLYFFTLGYSKYQLIDLNLLTTNQLNYLQKLKFKNTKGYDCDYPMVREYGTFYFFFCFDLWSSFCLKGSSLQNLITSTLEIDFQSAKIRQAYLMLDTNYLVYKNNIYTNLSSVTQVVGYFLIDQTYDIFLSDNKLCKASMNGKSFKCSKTYDFGVDNNYQDFDQVIISKVLASNGANLIFGYDYNKEQYVFFDVLTLNSIIAIGDTMIKARSQNNIFQYLGETIYLAQDSNLFILNINTLFPQNNATCPQDCFICSSQNECLSCIEGFVFNDQNNNQCLPCQKNCLVCTDQNTCTKSIECGAQFTYDNTQQKCVQCLWDIQIKQCVETCKSNQFYNQVQKTCSQCYYQNNTCLQQCTQGFYADASFQCQACHKSCMSCKGPLYNQCLRCYYTNECLTQSQIESQDQKNQKLIYANCDQISSDCSNLSNLSELIQKLFLGLFVMTQVLIFILFCTSKSNLLGWYYIQIAQLIGNLALNQNMIVLWLNIGFLKNLQSYNLLNLIVYNSFQNEEDVLIDFNKFNLGINISDFYKNFIQNTFYHLIGLEKKIIIYKSASEKKWKLSQILTNGRILFTKALKQLMDITFPLNYFIENDENLYIFSDYVGYQLIKLQDISSSDEITTQGGMIQTERSCKQYKIVKIEKIYVFICQEQQNLFYYEEKSLDNLKSSTFDHLIIKFYKFDSQFVNFDGSTLFFKGEESLFIFKFEVNDLYLIDYDSNLFLVEKQICILVHLNEEVCKDLGYPREQKNDQVALSKVFESNGKKIIFAYNYKEKEYQFFDAQTLSILTTNGKLNYVSELDIIQCESNVIIGKYQYEIQYDLQTQKINIIEKANNLENKFKLRYNNLYLKNFNQGNLYEVQIENYYYLITLDNCSLPQKQCPLNCLECDSNQVCLKCKKDFYLNPSNSCIQTCPSDFVIDSDKFRCVCDNFMIQKNKICECMPSFIRNSQNKCICPQNFHLDYNQKTCKCDLGFQLNENGQCICGWGKDTLNQDGTLYCVSKKCESLSNKDFQCKSCKLGYTIQPDGQCLLQNCLNYDFGKGLCLQCQKGFSLKNNFCQTHNCQKYDDEKQICTQCFDNLYLLENQCIPKNCQKFDFQLMKCTRCKPNYILLHDNTCDDKCPPSMQLSHDKSSCICSKNTIMSNCNGSSKYQCTSCYYGYALINSECQQLYQIEKQQQYSKNQEQQYQKQEQEIVFQRSSQTSFATSLALTLLTKQSFSILFQYIISTKLSYLLLVKTNFPIEIYISLKHLKVQSQLDSGEYYIYNYVALLDDRLCCQDLLPIQVLSNVYFIEENRAIIYKATDKIWRYSQLDQDGNIKQTNLIYNMDDLGISYYFIEKNLLYFFTDDTSNYQLIDLTLLTNNQQKYLKKLQFQNGSFNFLFCYGFFGDLFCIKGSSLKNLITSTSIIDFSSVKYEQAYLMFDKNYLVYKNNIYTDLSSVTQQLGHILIDQIYDIFLSDNKLCKASMNGKSFKCSTMYDLGISTKYKDYIKVIISKVFTQNGANLIFAYDYSKNQYIFFDVLTLDVIQTVGDNMIEADQPINIFQYQNYIFIKTNLYQVTYNSSSIQVSIKLITSSLPSNYYSQANYPFYNLNFQLGKTIYLANGNNFFILNINTLSPSKDITCPSNCFICSSQSECQYCNEGFSLNSINQCEQIQCIQNCSQCIDQSTCQTCKTGYYLQFDQTCKNLCPSSAQNDGNSKCICDPNANLIGGQCQCNQINNQCLPCSKNCLVCTDENTCTKSIECGAQFKYDNAQQKCVQCLWDIQIKQCVETCKNGQFINQDQKTCSQCYYQNNNCLQKCPQGYYADASFQCQVCHKSCLSCKGPLYNQCLRCYYTNECLTQSQIESQDQKNQKLIYANCDQISSDCSNLSNLSDLIQKLFFGLFVMTQVLIFILFCTSKSNLLGWYYIQIVQLIGNLALNQNMNVLWLNIGFLKNLQSYNLLNLIENNAIIYQNYKYQWIYGIFDNSGNITQDFILLGMESCYECIYILENDNLYLFEKVGVKDYQLIQNLQKLDSNQNFIQVYKRNLFNPGTVFRFGPQFALLYKDESNFHCQYYLSQSLDNLLASNIAQADFLICKNYELQQQLTIIDNQVSYKNHTYNVLGSDHISAPLKLINSQFDIFFKKNTLCKFKENGINCTQNYFGTSIISKISYCYQVNLMFGYDEKQEKYIFFDATTLDTYIAMGDALPLVQNSKNIIFYKCKIYITNNLYTISIDKNNRSVYIKLISQSLSQNYYQLVNSPFENDNPQYGDTIFLRQQDKYFLVNLDSICPQNCLQCSFSNPNICYTCDQEKKFLLTLEGQCVQNCPDTFIPDKQNSKCICRPNYDLQNAKCQCSKDYYKQKDETCCPFNQYGQNDVCQQCPSNCQQCDSQTNCTLCLQTYFLNIDKICISACPVKFFGQNGTCQQCPSNCDKCDSQTNCISCSQNYFLNNDKTCISNCPVKFFGQNGTCQQCPSNCDKCDSYTNCISCSQNYFLNIDKTCISYCPVKFFGQDGTCQMCPPNCESCSSLKNCTSCSERNYLVSDGSCLTECPTPYIKDDKQKKCVCRENSTFKDNLCKCNLYYFDDKNECKPCPENCSECQSQALCKLCKENYFLNSDKTCISACPVKFFGQNGTCQQCPSNCDKCDSQTNCISCSQNYFLNIDKTCISKCPVKFFGQDGTCQQCPSNCDKCDSYTNCISCSQNYFFNIDKTCISNCPVKFFGQDGTCQMCPPNCESCSSIKNCTSCSERNYLVSDGSCLTECPTPYIKDDKQKKCVCRENSTFKDNQCKCNLSYFDDNIDCKPCPENCSECESQKKCKLCKENYFLTIEQSCVSQCPNTFTFDSLKKQCVCGIKQSLFNNQCITCQDGCIECTSETNCTKKADCPQKQQYNFILKQCEKCLWDMRTQKCVTQCQDDQFHDKINNTCSKQCYYFNSECLNSCPENYYFDSNFQCNKCDPQCKSCYGPNINQCTKCNYPLFLQDDNTCSLCQLGTYFDSKQKMCISCSFTCLTCNGQNSNNCLSCTGDLVFQKETNTCISQKQSQIQNLEKQKLLYSNCEQTNIDCSHLFSMQEQIQKIFFGLSIST
ncbi:hypothetical protein ABPG73_012400, partial [Tetrahymena malaccensis]